MTLEKRPHFVHIITHGPVCLDGVAAAVAIARARPDAEVIPWFVNNSDVNDAVGQLTCKPFDAEHEVWITDVSWTDRGADQHLQNLAARGVRVHWMDHHRTAVQRFQAGDIGVPFSGCVISEEFAACRLVYEYLSERLDEPPVNQRFRDFWPVVERADDTDRWIHRLEGSHELALTVRTMGSVEAYRDLLEIDRDITYTPRMTAARQRIEAELRRSFETAERERLERQLPGGLVLVTTVCSGYPSEVAEQLGQTTRNAVFALFDSSCLAVSFRRSPDCTIDLSRLARAFGGGGHPAAAGCELPWLGGDIARGMADMIAPVLARGLG